MLLNLINTCLLYSKWEYSPLERLYVGLWTGLTFSMFMLIYRTAKNKKVFKKEVQQAFEEIDKHQSDIQKGIAAESLTWLDNRDLEELRSSYSNLYSELKALCNPAEYMNPYDARKVDISNSIYSRIESAKDEIPELIKLRNEATEKLGITFSCDHLYPLLCKVFNPAQYTGDNYDEDKLYAANSIFNRIIQNKDNIVELETIAADAGFSVLDIPTSRTANDEKIQKVNADQELIVSENDNCTENKNDNVPAISWTFVLMPILLVVIISYLLIHNIIGPSPKDVRSSHEDVTSTSYVERVSPSGHIAASIPSDLKLSEFEGSTLFYKSEEMSVAVFDSQTSPEYFYKAHYFSESDNTISLRDDHYVCVDNDHTYKCFARTNIDKKAFMIVVISDSKDLKTCCDVLFHIQNNIRLLN